MDAKQAETERTDETPVIADNDSIQKDSKGRGANDGGLKLAKSKKLAAKRRTKSNKKFAKGKLRVKEDETGSEEADSDSSDSSDSSTDDNGTEDTSDESSEDSESETEVEKRKRKARERKDEQKRRDKKNGKSRRRAASDSSSSEDSEADDSSTNSEEDSEDSEDSDSALQRMQDMQQLQQLQQLQMFRMLQQQQLQPQQQQYQNFHPALNLQPLLNLGNGDLAGNALLNLGGRGKTSRDRGKRIEKKLEGSRSDRQGRRVRKEKKSKKEVKNKRASRLEYKRVDQLWDKSIHNYKLTDTTEDDESSEYDQYLFNVRRTFDWEGKYKSTVVDIKSNLLKEALSDVMEGVKGVSLVEDTPSVDPNLLFLYLEDLRTALSDLKAKIKSGKKMKRKVRKNYVNKAQHIKVLIKYLDKDYADTKKALYPMLESGLITFDLLWALYKPSTLAYTTTYGIATEARAFKIEFAEKICSLMKGEWYNVEGKYLEYDGKTWGMATTDADVYHFKGARKITSLACYPLKYHKEEGKLREELIERGKKFVALQGVHYKSHDGMAFCKKKRQIIKVHINGRVMIDPAIHRRMFPNYQTASVKPNESDDTDDSSVEDSSDDSCEFDSSEEDTGGRGQGFEDLEEHRKKGKAIVDDVKEEITDLSSTKEGKNEEKGHVEDKIVLPTFTDEEYMIASPLVLGFAFAEKMWLEFTVSGIKDIAWNEGAYDSLVLENNTKDIVKALVESHKYHPAKSIDDVIQGKGKGLVAVLHGPPGTGKTLTAEGISELLKCPLYMVSAGELGTDPRTLEAELQKILDIAHAWGAVLLLDEADVFLEKRTIQDIHRNALVSIFLRLLEYFQGILFLTTNRVETFDDAFQSRIHIALRYGELSHRAKKSVFKLFIERVRVMENKPTMPFTELDYDNLSKNSLNGRQIKNTVRTAQALAINKNEPLGMEHIKRVLDVLLAFDMDLKGPGARDAMHNYM